jgi:hypothetical protein
MYVVLHPNSYHMKMYIPSMYVLVEQQHFGLVTYRIHSYFVLRRSHSGGLNLNFLKRGAIDIAFASGTEETCSNTARV